MDMNEKLDLILIKLDEQGKKLDEQGKKLDDHSRILADHSSMFGALMHAQEELNANMSGFKIEVTQQLGEFKDTLDSFGLKQEDLSAKIQLLADRTWTNESDIHRLKNIAGIK